MIVIFYTSSVVAIASTIIMLTRVNLVHALLYFVVSLLAVAIVFYSIGAPLIAALEVIVYAGAIMVLFVFVIMMLNPSERAIETERSWLQPSTWVGPAGLSGVLMAEVAYLVSSPISQPAMAGRIVPEQVGIVLFGPYLIAVELASVLLLAGLVGAYHLGNSGK